ncbi:MAG: hypothetical protein ACM37Z_00825, partial [Deltaproteobacteria bacterium]
TSDRSPSSGNAKFTSENSAEGESSRSRLALAESSLFLSSTATTTAQALYRSALLPASDSNVALAFLADR